MASLCLGVRRVFRPVRLASFYSLFFSVVIIFATIIYIQIVSQFNIPIDSSTDRRNNMLLHDIDLVMIFTTRGSFKNNSLRVAYNISRILNNSDSNFVSSNVSSSQVVQSILRSYDAIQSNRTKNVTTIESLFLNNSKSFNKNESVETLVLVRYGNESAMDVDVEKTLTNITEETEKLAVNSSKTIASINGLPNVNGISASLLSVNISKFDSSQLDNKLVDRNSTTVRRRGIRPRNSKRPNYCPLWPHELVGLMPVEQMSKLTDIPKENLRWIKDGGRFKPPDCDPRERTAIIIPYRDREKHLNVILRHLHIVLQRQKIEYGIFVVEMAFPTQFNRGLLANVGFLTASSAATYTCYIIHDVDLLVQDDRNMYRCGRVPRHLTASNTKFENNLPYLGYFGGVEAFTPDQYWKLNGFSNLYFGWGAEDDDMVYRIVATKQHFARPRQQIGGYLALDHEKDSSNPQNPNRIALLKSARTRMSEDGVKSVMYSRLALEFKPLYTWVYIAAKEAKYMEKYQQYLENG